LFDLNWNPNSNLLQSKAYAKTPFIDSGEERGKRPGKEKDNSYQKIVPSFTAPKTFQKSMPSLRRKEQNPACVGRKEKVKV